MIVPETGEVIAGRFWFLIVLNSHRGFSKMPDGRGGRRPGAGRKPTAEKFATKIAAAEKQIADKLPDLIGNLFKLAEGVSVQDIDSEGEVTVYQKPPDYKANEYLINRIMGKPTERHEQIIDLDAEIASIMAELAGSGKGEAEGAA